MPLFRVMGAFEQKQEVPDRNYQYIVIAAQPYESICFKVPNMELERDSHTGKYGQTEWDEETKVFTLTINYL